MYKPTYVFLDNFKKLRSVLLGFLDSGEHMFSLHVYKRHSSKKWPPSSFPPKTDQLKRSKDINLPTRPLRMCSCTTSRKSPFFVVPLSTKQAKKLWLQTWTIISSQISPVGPPISRRPTFIVCASLDFRDLANLKAQGVRLKGDHHYLPSWLHSAILPHVSPTHYNNKSSCTTSDRKWLLTTATKHPWTFSWRRPTC